MRIHHYTKQIHKLSIKEIRCRLCTKMVNRKRHFIQKFKDAYYCTYNDSNEEILPIIINIDNPHISQDIINVANNWMNHYFDILGSGWISYNERTIKKYNIVSKANAKVASSIAKFISKSYKPIAWHVDIKSGYHWPIKKWYLEMPIGLPGIDIKVPWELGRMQHIPILAEVYYATKDEQYKQEFCDEIYDFIVHNPPRFGVNWRCTMDVGIRAANWTVAYDIFCSVDDEFSREFKKVFANSLVDHAKHILNNLEYSPSFRGNHYLSDIAGLLFVSMHLTGERADSWLLYSLQELLSEMKEQFHNDGTNFEASTCYHRLSAEIMTYCTLYALQMPQRRKNRLMKIHQVSLYTTGPEARPYNRQEFDLTKPEIFPSWYWDRLANMLRFISDLLHDDGTIPPIGDDDSGRFFKLSPVYKKLSVQDAVMRYINLSRKNVSSLNNIYYDEQLLDATHCVSIYKILFKNEQEQNDFETSFVYQLTKNKVIPTVTKAPFIPLQLNLDEELQKLHLDRQQGNKYTFYCQDDIIKALTLTGYPGIGIYIYRSPILYMTIRCGEIGQHDQGGHAHNDQLSLTLQMNGVDIIRDIGTYLYTPDVEARNYFRSTKVHFTPQCIIDKEQNIWESGQLGLFAMLDDRTKAEIVYIGLDGVIMKHIGYGKPVYRVVIIQSNQVQINDYGENLRHWKPSEVWSNGYGRLLKW